MLIFESGYLLISFVFIKGYTQQVFKIEEILYIEIPVFSTPSGPLHAYRIDVDVETIVATATDTGREIVLKAPPLQEKRTCEECRRLADHGAYEESIAAYREFILNNEGHFQIDDAYYAIAEIFDTKLFQYNDALYWYSQLLEKYSQSSLSSMARQRAEYLRLYDDFDFIPLSQFERIRRVEYFRHKKDPEQRQALINRVKQIILDYPDSTIRPSIHYWLANQLRDIDIDDAVAEYEVLLKEFPVLLDYNSAAGIKYDVDEVPVTVIIGPEGRLLFKRTGYSPAVKRQLFSKLESLVEQT